MDAEVVAVAAEVAAVVVEGMVIGPVLIQGKLFYLIYLFEEFLIHLFSCLFLVLRSS